MGIALLDRPLAITDYETTGLDPDVHEIIEIGLVVVDQATLKMISELDLKVKPTRIETASPKALEINGYTEEDWRGACSLHEAMQQFASHVGGAMLLAHNMGFEWSFTRAAFKATGITDPMDYHRCDTLTNALESLRHSGLEKFNLVKVAEFLGIEPEPMPHRAINGARQATDVYRKLRELNRRLWNPEVLAQILSE